MPRLVPGPGDDPFHVALVHAVLHARCSHDVLLEQVHRDTASVADEAFIRVDDNSSHVVVDSLDIAPSPGAIDK